jgi:hypothetical protein
MEAPGRVTSYAVGNFITVSVEDGRTMWSGVMPRGDGLDVIDVQSNGFEVLASSTTYSLLRAGVSTCGLGPQGNLDCWGSNAYGQLGDGTRTSDLSAHRVKLTERVVDFDVGVTHACATTNQGSVFCWGGNSFGMLGDPELTVEASPLPHRVRGLVDADAVRCGSAGTCALVSGDLWCWGAAITGPGGPVPAQETHFGDILAFDVGDGSACALRADHSVWCGGNVAYDSDCQRTRDWKQVDFTLSGCESF